MPSINCGFRALNVTHIPNSPFFLQRALHESLESLYVLLVLNNTAALHARFRYSAPFGLQKKCPAIQQSEQPVREYSFNACVNLQCLVKNKYKSTSFYARTLPVPCLGFSVTSLLNLTPQCLRVVLANDRRHSAYFCTWKRGCLCLGAES